ncbi:site-specific integrase [Vibrio sp. 624788]|uniref:site-specific integrase n=1 Tax=Vibrio sp. 624788 TaxID=1234362 RepID=UPI00031C3707|nr:site-specific integrase [Vibrio sp. 624788]
MSAALARSKALAQVERQFVLLDEYSPKHSRLLSDFNDNEWKLLLGDGGASYEYEFSFDHVIDAGLSLTGEKELLKSVKWLVLLSIVDTDAAKSPLGNETSIRKYLDLILYFVRYMRGKGIRKPNYAPLTMVQNFAENLVYSIGANLNYIKRFNDFSHDKGHDLSEYCEKERTNNVGRFFDISKMLFDIGIATSSWSSFYELADISDSLRKQYEDNNSKPTELSGKKKSIHKVSTEGSTQKSISFLNRMLKTAKYFPELVPMIPSDLLPSPKKVRKTTQNKARKDGKTKDVPFIVMKETLERSIKYIIHFSQLTALRDKSLKEFEELVEAKPNQKRSGLAKEHFRKNPIFLKGDEELGFPDIRITNFDRTAKNKATDDDKAKWARVAELNANGESMAAIAKKEGVAKGTISKWIAQHHDPYRDEEFNYGLSTMLHNHMLVAIEMVICFLTARRSIEVNKLEAGCISTTESGHWIEMYVAKTYQVHDHFPATNLVKICIELLESISLPVRKATGNNLLFQYPSFSGEKKSSQYLFKDCRAGFLEFIGIQGDYSWDWSEHQFRRFFAGTFVNHYGGSVDALKYHLRHTDIAMTFEYLNKLTDGDNLDTLQSEAMMEVLDQQAQTSGGFSEDTEVGKKFNECVSLAVGISEKRAQNLKRFNKLVKQDDIVFEMIEEGLCVGNTPAYRERSKCITGDGLAQTIKANCEFCKGCPNKILLDNWEYKNIGEQCLMNPEESNILSAVLENF